MHYLAYLALGSSVFAIILTLAVYWISNKINNKQFLATKVNYATSAFVSKNDDINMLAALGAKATSPESSQYLKTSLRQAYSMYLNLIEGYSGNPDKDLTAVEDFKSYKQSIDITIIDKSNNFESRSMLEIEDLQTKQNILFILLFFVNIISIYSFSRLNILTLSKSSKLIS